MANEGLQESFTKHVIILAVLLGGGHTQNIPYMDPTYIDPMDNLGFV